MFSLLAIRRFFFIRDEVAVSYSSPLVGKIWGFFGGGTTAVKMFQHLGSKTGLKVLYIAKLYNSKQMAITWEHYNMIEDEWDLL